MATLIGDGAHASDILRHLDHRWRQVAHHSQWDNDLPVIIGINDPQLRARVADEMGVRDTAWTHHDSMVDHGCSFGYGTHINYGVTMTRTTIGHHTTISPGVTCCGDVTIGDRVLIGAGSTICDRVTIGNDVTIGAGAVVLPETVIPDGETWFGVPARCHV